MRNQRITASFAVVLGLALLATPGVVWAGGCGGGAAHAHSEASILDMKAKRLSGEPEALDRYRGQVLLVVNTASRCGYTPQYKGLQTLYDTYRERGFSVLGFPSNDFGGQEPGTNQEIGAFCQSRFGVDFPMFSKVSVKGDDAHPVYAYLTGLPKPIGGPVQWNFQKYLVDRDGHVVARFAPGVEPLDGSLVGEIERLLGDEGGEEKTAMLADTGR